MMQKYRVHDVAVDLNLDSKDIINMIKDYSEEPKKSMTALTDEELDIIFDTFTQNNNYPNLNDYFSVRFEKEKAEKAAKEAAVAKEKAEAEAKAARLKAAKEAEEKAAKEKAEREARAAKEAKEAEEKAAAREKAAKQMEEDRKKAQTLKQETPVKSAEKPAEKKAEPSRRNDFRKPAQFGATGNTDKKHEQQRSISKHHQNDNIQEKKPGAQNLPKPFESRKKDKQDVIPEVTVRERRVVDTRTSNVNVDRYNEKYDNLAYDKVKNETTAQKQKFLQRSQKRGKKQSRKETEAERLDRIALERKTKTLTITVPDEITVGEFSTRLKATSAEVIKKLMLMGEMKTINDMIDFDTAVLVADEFHAKVEKEVHVTIEERIIDDSIDDDSSLVTRAPVVVVMGHVDHGKTSLLDAIRHSHVTEGEAGGITQHIGAYQVKMNGRDITFLDTPGHAAFTTMRARGAQVTDIAVLVVAADDGVMPQTVEAINHAKAANVSIIVAINKMDKPGANPELVKQQLTEYGIVPEEWGGDTPCIPVSAYTKQGIDDLLEMIILTADVLELKANPNRQAKGTVIEARLDKGRGPIATVLVQNGTLRSGDIIVAGSTVGRVRAMTDENGIEVQEAGPSMPVEITGLGEVPIGGDIFNAVSDEKLARQLVEQRSQQEREEVFNKQEKVTLDNLFDQMKEQDMKVLKVIVKADVQGSVEAVRQSLEKLTNEEVRVEVIHEAVGAVNESDVMLASASNAIIVGFNVRPDPVAEENAKRDGVDIRLYRIIYDCINEIESAMKGMLAPKYREAALGKAECREIYKISSVGTVIGSHVTTGKITRDALVRIVRDGIIVADDHIASLRRFKDDVKEVQEGFDCGITLEKFNDVKTGDILEVYTMEEYKE
jgi:translation initiation factor IF-2